MVDSKENYKFDLGIKELRYKVLLILIACIHNTSSNSIAARKSII